MIIEEITKCMFRVMRFFLKHFFDSSVPCSFSASNIQKYLRKMKKSELLLIHFLLLAANVHLAELRSSSAAAQGLFMLLWAVCAIASRANPNLQQEFAKLQLEHRKQSMTFGESLN